MTEFKVTYPSGMVEVVSSSDWATADDVARSKFGMDSAVQLKEEFNVTVSAQTPPVEGEKEEDAPPES